MADIKRIGILTSGGDCGGLNAMIKGAASKALSSGIEAVAIPNGYAGLYNLIDMEEIVTFTRARISQIAASDSGSEIGNSRVKVKKIEDSDKYERIKSGLKKFNIDALVIGGGDDTGSVIVDLLAQGIPCVHVPKTMDLDLQSYSVGGDSAINNISMVTRHLQTTGRSHNRIMIVEVFGRYVGHTALRGGVGAEADCILIPEIPVDFDIVYKHVKKVFFSRIEHSDVKSGTYTIVVSEGLKAATGELLYDENAGTDAFGHKKLAGAGKYVRQQLEKRLKNDSEVKEFMQRTGMFVPGVFETPEVREVIPTHLVRAGHASAYDVNFGQKAGIAAVVLLIEGKSGNTIINVDGKNILYLPTADIIKRRTVDLDEVALFESSGICFGRKSQTYEYELISEKRRKIVRHL